MRKLLVLVLLIAMGVSLFAADGTVLPGGVFRLRAIPAYSWMPGSYDNNGKYTTTASDSTGTITAPNLGFALEYGINDWITLGFQWAPGITFDSNVPESGSTTYNVNGLSDLFAGLLVQIVGPKAPVASDVVRFDLAPGVTIPFGGADFSKQAQNNLSGSATTVENPDYQVLGVGGRLYLDYLFSKSFYIDLYSQFLYYPGTVSLQNYSYAGYKASTGYAQYTEYYTPTEINYNPQVSYGYTLRIEIDPNYNVDIADGINLAVDCAFRYDGTPDSTWSTAVPAGFTALTGVSPTPHSSLFTANPALTFFFYKAVVPFELELDYGQPIWGVNANASYILDLQIEAYLKL
jgi:hypothetical protein